MSRRPPHIDRGKVSTVSARGRGSKVRTRDEATPYHEGASFSEFLAGLPSILGASELRAAVDAWSRAWTRRKTVVWGFGAHLIKVGLAPVVVDLMERGAISGLMMNGAGCVHDLELAMMGRTSEDVAEALDDGSFGMARETAERLNRAIGTGAEQGLGMGESVGGEILEGRYRYKQRSVLATAARLGIPVTVHVAIGTDIHHMHPGADGAALGATSHRDFETLTGLVATLEGGVVFNVGSAVILPEVFLKALSLARNLGNRVERFTAVNLDFIRHYRPEMNVVQRPTRLGGRGISLLGHHEIMVPLLAAGVIEAHARGGPGRGDARRRPGARAAPGKRRDS
ncbi:MAG: deoxyhypusine synthase family protein [Deltaproteobacteria bacterium]|nr:deoxyhypusine synthase family protein [Deltaproteobacteria bacterium]